MPECYHNEQLEILSIRKILLSTEGRIKGHESKTNDEA